MKIENPKLVIGLYQIIEGVISICRGGQQLLDPEGKQLLDPEGKHCISDVPADPSLAQSAPAAATEKVKKGKSAKTAASEVASAAAENLAAAGSATPAAGSAPALTHDAIRERIQEYMALPNVGKEKGKALVLAFGVEKLSQLTQEQLPELMLAINSAMTAAKSSAEEI